MNSRPAIRRLAHDEQAGFTMFEVLVTLLILSVGLLGNANLQIVALKQNDSAYLRSQASLISLDIMDLLRANRTLAATGNYNLTTLSAFSELRAPSGDASIAEFDRYHWYRKLDAALPSAKGAIDCDANAICKITVQWDDSRAEASASRKQLVLAGQL